MSCCLEIRQLQRSRKMPKIHQGELKGRPEWKVAVVVSRFNELITSKLLSGTLDCLTRHGISDENIDVYWVPGAFEIPATCQRLARKKAHVGIICLGAVIRGATPHFEYVASEAAKGIAQAAMTADAPVIFSVLTTDTIEQALERAGTKSGNKGFDGALNLLEMIQLYEKIGPVKG